MKAPRMSLAERLVAATRKISLVGETSALCCVIPPGSSSAAELASLIPNELISGRIKVVSLDDLPSTSTSRSALRTCRATPSSLAGVIGGTNEIQDVFVRQR